MRNKLNREPTQMTKRFILRRWILEKILTKMFKQGPDADDNIVEVYRIVWNVVKHECPADSVLTLKHHLRLHNEEAMPSTSTETRLIEQYNKLNPRRRWESDDEHHQRLVPTMREFAEIQDIHKTSTIQRFTINKHLDR